MTLAAPTIRPGDPPPFWDGPWHPTGQADGAVMAKPLAAGQAHAFPAFSVGQTATVTIPQAAAPAAVAEPVASPAHAEVARTVPAPEPVIAAPPPAEPVIAPPPPEPVIAAPPPAEPVLTPPPSAEPAAQAPPAADRPAPPRSYVTSLFAAGPIRPAPGVPEVAEPEMTAQFRTYAKQLQGQGKFAEALQGLNEALRRSPGEAATYAQLGSLMLAGKAWEDAGHHFLIAYMLAPRELSYARMTLHASWMLGYVAWSYQIAMALHKAQPTPDVAEIGRAAQVWLAGRGPAVTQFCPACRISSIAPAPGPCAKCGGATMGASANAVGFSGLKLLQQTPPTGRLFAGAHCASCKTDTVLLMTRSGPACLTCRGPALANV